MSKFKILIVLCAVAAPIHSITTVAFAATAHNSQTGANTSNPYGSYADALAKRQR